MSTTPTHPPRDTRPIEPGSVSPESPSPSASSSAFPLHNPTAPDQIGAWLDRLLRLARLPAREATELRDELDAHLRERVRDLMLAGDDEPDAIHKSISELGDLALLAQRYREASRTPRRRLAMHIALIAVASTALGLSTIALQRAQPETQPEGVASLAPGAFRLSLVPEDVGPDGQGTFRIGLAPREGRQATLLGDIPLVGSLFPTAAAPSWAIGEDVGEASLAQLFSMLAESQDLKPYIHWRDLEHDSETVLTDLPFAGQQLDRAFDMLDDALELEGESMLAYRIEAGLFEVASRGYFDRRERELVTYEVTELVDASNPLEVTDEAGVLVELIVEIVEPDAWSENGGEIAMIAAVGGKLFVNAPPRLHERVAWLLAELQRDAAAVHPGQ